MFQKKAEQAIETVPDTENVAFVMQAVYAAEFDSMKCLADGRIAALFQKDLSGASKRGRHVPKDGGESQHTLIYEVIVQLFLHVRIEGEIHNLAERIEEHSVF